MKKIFFTLILIFIVLNSLLYPTITITATKEALSTWFYQVLPALLPFCMMNHLLVQTHWLSMGFLRNNFLAVLFVSLLGCIFGFPLGAKLTCSMYKEGRISLPQAQILAVTSNQFSFMYICGYVLPNVTDNSNFILAFCILIYGLPGVIGILLALLFKDKGSNHKNTASRFQLNMQIIDAGIVSSFETLIKLCGYIVIFSLLTATLSIFITQSNPVLGILLCNLEITNGIGLFSKWDYSNKFKYILTTQLISFGGICGLYQSASILYPNGLSIKKYFIGKITLSAVLTGIVCIFYDLFFLSVIYYG